MISPKQTYVIAEMACSHDGDVELAKTIIDGAACAAADATQFQVWQARHMMVPHHPAMPTLKALELPREGWAELAAHVRNAANPMHIIGCVYDKYAVEMCMEIGVDAFKIHSADLSNPDLLRLVASTGKRIDLSAGASSVDEIRKALDVIGEHADTDVWLMYGYQSFPTPTDAIHLRFMMKLKELFELPVGYQDHSDAESDAAFWLPAAAVGMGVDIIEKHITHDRSKKGVDHEAALNPDEFIRFTEMIREIDIAQGCAVPRAFSIEEQEYRKYAKKSLVAARVLPAGTVLDARDLIALRAPDLGIPPDEIFRLVGRKTRGDLSQFSLVTEADVE